MIVKNLQKIHFEEYPVWAWTDSEDAHEPVLQIDPLPDDRGTLFVRATFTAPNGHRFDGYIVGATAYSVSLFVENSKVKFNCNLPPFVQKEIDRLFDLLNEKPFDLFPLKYETDFHFQGEPNLAGDFIDPRHKT